MKTQTQSLFALALIPCACLAAIAAGSSSNSRAAVGPRSTVDDWSHHHLIYSNPGTEEESWQRNDHERWLQITSDPRFKLQQLKRNAQSQTNAAPVALDASDTPDMDASDEETTDASSTAVDSSAAGIASQFPDGKLPRWIAPLSPSEVSQTNSAIGKSPRAPKFVRARKKLHIDWSVNMGNGATVGAGMFPAKFSFDVSTASCGNAATPDFVVYNTSLPGSASRSSIIAYDNLYSGCSGAVPSTYWAYNTNGGAIVTSVILSLDGSQVAFAQSKGGAASLVILKWNASTTDTASSPTTLPSTASASYRSCVAPCMTVIPFSGGADDSGSAPFYDYSGADTLYIGDDAGKLHKFTGIFSGTPAEVLATWPIAVGGINSALSSPVYDSTSGRIFVGDYLTPLQSVCSSGAPCGLLYAISASTGLVVGTSSRLDHNQGLVDAPLVDSAAARVYAFAGDDGNNGSTSPCSPFNCAGVFQFPASFNSGSGTEATVGDGFLALYSGTFDNAYFNSASGSSPTGHLYVVGGTGKLDNTLFQIPITLNVMSTVAVSGPVLATNVSSSSQQASGFQVTEFFNGTQDLIFTSVPIAGVAVQCGASGCVLGFNVTSGVITALTTPVIASSEAGGASGIIIDSRSSSVPGTLQIYFSPLQSQTCTTSGTHGGCAIQTAQ